MMNLPDTLEDLFALDEEGGDGDRRSANPGAFDEMVRTLLTDLCRELSLASAVAEGISSRRRQAQARCVAHADGVRLLLELCALAGVEVCDGPPSDWSPLGPPRRN